MKCLYLYLHNTLSSAYKERVGCEDSWWVELYASVSAPGSGHINGLMSYSETSPRWLKTATVKQLLFWRIVWWFILYFQSCVSKPWGRTTSKSRQSLHLAKDKVNWLIISKKKNKQKITKNIRVGRETAKGGLIPKQKLNVNLTCVNNKS